MFFLCGFGCNEGNAKQGVVTQRISMRKVSGSELGHNTVNPLTPNDHYSGRTEPLTSKRCILYIYSTNIGTEYFKHGIYSPFFSL